jgi:hypothetical protein
MIESETERGGVVAKESRYYLCLKVWMRTHSFGSCAVNGESRMACIGCWMSSSTTILRAYAKATVPPTWRS